MLRSIRRGGEHRVFVRGATSTRRGSAVAATRSKRHGHRARRNRQLNRPAISTSTLAAGGWRPATTGRSMFTPPTTHGDVSTCT